MLDSELRNKIREIWDKFYDNGINDTLDTVEQLSYLIFIRRLEVIDIQNQKRLKGKYKSIYKNNEEMKWSHFTQMSSEEMLKHVRDKVFPFIQKLDVDESFYTEYMKDAKLSIPVQKAFVLSEVITMLEEIKISSKTQDVQGDIYEELLADLSIRGKNGQFRTPRHIIEMMVEIISPKIGETVCDPACGTGGFIFNAYEHIVKENTSKENLKNHQLVGDKITNPKHWKVLHNETYTGFDTDETMVRTASLNMLLHGIAKPNIQLTTSSISKSFDQGKKYDIILANPPFSGGMNKSTVHEDFIDSTKTELLFLNLFYNILEVGGRAAVIVPMGVLFGSGKAHLQIRKMLLEKCNLNAIVYMPSGIFKPYSGVSTAILFFKKGGKTDKIWLYDMENDGHSLDDKRDEIDENDIPDIIEKYKKREDSKKSITITIDDVKENEYNLNVRRYIDNSIPEKTVDIQKVNDELSKLKDERKKHEEQLNKDLKKLGFDV